MIWTWITKKSKNEIFYWKKKIQKERKWTKIAEHNQDWLWKNWWRLENVNGKMERKRSPMWRFLHKFFLCFDLQNMAKYILQTHYKPKKKVLQKSWDSILPLTKLSSHFFSHTLILNSAILEVFWMRKYKNDERAKLNLSTVIQVKRK